MHFKAVVFLCSIICIQQTLTTLSEELAELFGDESAPTTDQTEPTTIEGLRDLYSAIVEKYPDQPVTQELTKRYFEDDLSYSQSYTEIVAQFLDDQPHTVEEFIICLQQGELLYHTEVP